MLAPGAACLRVGSYNVRVDHDQDVGTIHDWPIRRPLLASSIRGCRCDVLALQEPSPAQAEDLAADLGPEWCVVVSACDPAAWQAAGASGPTDGQARDGNGFIWDARRMELLDGGVRTIWLNDQPDKPWQGPKGAWGGSIYQRTAVLGRFRDRQSGAVLAVISAHLDHAGDDLHVPRDAPYAPPPPGAKVEGSEARVRSVELIMRMAKAEEPAADLVVVCGDMNSFRDRDGQCYRALLHGAGAAMVDVRDAPGVLEVDSGRGAASWEGWGANAWCRELKPESEGYPNRYDQVTRRAMPAHASRIVLQLVLVRMNHKARRAHLTHLSHHLTHPHHHPKFFVSRKESVQALRTTVVQERYLITPPDSPAGGLVYASDHLPLLADLAVVPSLSGLVRASHFGRGGGRFLEGARWLASAAVAGACLLVVARRS